MTVEQLGCTIFKTIWSIKSWLFLGVFWKGGVGLDISISQWIHRYGILQYKSKQMKYQIKPRNYSKSNQTYLNLQS